MTDENQIEDQDVELHDEVTDEVMEENGHDPKNAPAQAVASVDKAEKAAPDAKDRKGDETKQDPMPKTKAGMLQAMYTELSNQKKDKLIASYQKLMTNGMPPGLGLAKAESVESDDDASLVEYNADFSEDLNALVESEATLSDEFKTKAGIIFETAIRSKLSEEIDRLEAKYNEELAEEIESTKSDLL